MHIRGVGSSFILLSALSVIPVVVQAEQCTSLLTEFKERPSIAMARFFENVVHDIIDLHKNLISWDSAKIIAGVFPLFVAGRMIDERLQSCFYKKSHHKNINQFPRWCHDAAKWSIGIPIVFLGSDILFGKTERHRVAARVFIAGMPFVIWSKDLIKKFKVNACLRPKCEFFDHKKKYYGGFPSGHMAEIMYMTVLYGLQFGYRYALPLGAIAAFIGTTFLTCNRHYVSQLVAGAAFGSMYAVAAHKLINAHLENDRLTVGFSAMPQGGVGLSIAWAF